MPNQKLFPRRPTFNQPSSLPKIWINSRDNLAAIGSTTELALAAFNSATAVSSAATRSSSGKPAVSLAGVGAGSFDVGVDASGGGETGAGIGATVTGVLVIVGELETGAGIGCVGSVGIGGGTLSIAISFVLG